MRLPRVPASIPAVGLCLLFAACGGDKIVLPNDTVPAAIAVVRGNGQTGTVGALLADSVIVRVTDAGGRPVEDQPVTFSVTVGGGSVAPLTANTNADGRAGVRWTLGTTAGAQSGQAKVTGSGAPANLIAAFSATANPAGAATIVRVSGNSQTGTAGSALTDSLVVRVADAASNPVAGVSISWTVTGGGTLSAPTVPTGADGRAAVEWTLGPTAGAQTATAAATGLVGSPIVFDATAVVGAAGKLSITTQPSGTAQSGVAFAQQPEIQLLDIHDNPVKTQGVAITAAIASGSGASLVGSVIAGTDVNGLARFSGLGLSAPAGTYKLSFSGPSLSGITSGDIVVAAGSAAALSLTVPPSATASSGVPLTTQPVIQLVDGSGNPVALTGKTVVAAIQSGAATLSGTTSRTTNVSGVATFTNLTLSGAAGSQVTLSFNAAGLVGVSSGTITIGAGTVSAGNSTLAVTGSPITASSGASTATVTVTARDASNNVIPGAAVSVSVTGNNSVTQPAGGVADGSGVATATVSSTEAGIKTVTATINGTAITQQGTLTVNPAGVSASQSTVAAAPTSIQAVSGTSTITVTVRDAFDNAIPGATVAIAATGSGNSITQPPAVTNASGVAIGSLSSSAAGPKVVSASATKGGGPVGITQTATVTVNIGTANVSVSASPASSVTGQTVTFTATVTGGSGTPTGTVQFQVDAVDTGSPVALSGGSAQLSTPLDAGTHTITANYSGNGTYAAGSGSLANYVVNLGATTVTISGDSPDPSVAGASYTVTFAVFASAPASGTPTGTVTASDGTVSCTGSAPSGSCTLASPTSGSKTLTVTYEGDTDFASSSRTTAHTVTAAAATVGVTSSDNPSVAGEAVTFTATVSGSAGTPTGSVQFAFGGTPVGGPVTLDGSGKATTTTSALTVGTHSVTATYGGSATYASGAVGTLAGGQAVGQGSTTTAVTLTSGTNPSVAGSTVTFTAVISVTAPASGSATGSVQFQDGGTDLGTPQTITAGSASLTTSALTAATHSITAVYGGDADFTGSTSPALSHTVTAANGAPSAAADAYSTAEDAALTVPAGTGLLANDSDPDSDPLTVVLDDAPSHGSLGAGLNADGSFTYTPDADFNGSDQFTYHATDGTASSATVTVSITIDPVNDAPVFTVGADQSLVSPTGPQSVPGWATGISAGPADEAGQTVTFEVTANSNPAIFTTAPAVAADGTLSWEPSGVVGTSTITIRLTDNGGTANGGVDTSPTQTFAITVN